MKISVNHSGFCFWVLILLSVASVVNAAEESNGNGPFQGPLLQSTVPPGAWILAYSDDSYTPFASRYPFVALDNLGLSGQYYATDSPPDFLAKLTTSGPWSLVVVDHANSYTMGQYWPQIQQFILQGGKAIVTTFDIDESHSVQTTLWSTMGVSYVSDIVPNLLPPSEKVYWWQPTHPIVKNVPQFTGAWSGGYVDFGDYIQETYGTIDHSIAGFSVSPQNAKSAIVVANDNRTIVNSFIIDENRNDLDADSVLDAVELYMNEIQFVISSPPRQAVGGEILPTVIPTLIVVLVLAVAIGLATGLHLSKRGQWILIKP